MSNNLPTQVVQFEGPVEAYEATRDEIIKLLRQVETGLEAHDKRASLSGGINWGHVGDLNGILHVLNDLKGRLHKTGEYKK